MFASPQTAPAAHAGGLSGLGEVTLALLLVLGAIFALAWLLKRVRGFNSRVGTSLEVIAHVPVGAKERALLLKVGPTQVLIGVAPGRVNTLYVLPEPLELERPGAAPPESGPASFRSLLKNLTR